MDHVPSGYRQGVLTAITLFLGFSLAFIRFWSIEASGVWTSFSVISAILIGVSIVLQLVALFRALNLRDERVSEYSRTVRWLFAGVVTLAAGVAASIFSANA